MIQAIKRFFENNLSITSTTSSAEKKHRIELACAALLIEVTKTDSHIDTRETTALVKILKATFSLDDSTLTSLLLMADLESRQATSLYEFTSLVNAAYTYEERVQLLENLWQIAFADNSIDRYEEHLIRKIADLIYVNHSDFIRTKLKVRDLKQTGTSRQGEQP